MRASANLRLDAELEGLPAQRTAAPAPAESTLNARFIALWASCALVLAASIAAATSAWGRPFASLWVDAYGDYSVVSMPAWRTSELGIPAQAHLVAIADEPVTADAARLGVAPQLDERLKAAVAAGQREIALTFQSPGGDPHRVVLPLRTVGRDELSWYFGLYLLLGCSFLTSGLVVLHVGGRRPAAWAYAFVSVSSFVFLATFFDYHTTRWLVPLFGASSMGNAVGLVALAATFPVPAWSGPRARALGRAGLVAGGLCMAALALGPFLPIDLRPLRQVAAAAVGASLLLLTVAVGLRWWRARGREALELRAVMLGFLVLPGALAIAFAVNVVVGSSVFHLVLPFAGLIVPASVGFALVRHNVLGISSVVTRRMVALPLAFIALTAGALAAIFAMELAEARQAAAVASLLGVLVAAVVFVPGWQLVQRWAFPAATRFRPTMLSLSDEVKARRDPDAIRAHLGRITSSLVPDAEARVLSLDEVREVCAQASLPEDLFATRGYLFDGDDPFQRALYVPMRSGGELLGALRLSAKRSGAPYTSEEVAQLEVVAGLGALAVHNAQVVKEQELRHALESSARREDRRLAVDILAAEIAHEVAYPLNYFRHFLRQLANGATPRADDIEIGAEEVQRLERMLASLRKLQLTTPALQLVSLKTVADRAVVLLAASPEERLRIEVDVPDELQVLADPDSLLQVFANLLRNASQWAGEGGRVGVRAQVEGGAVDLEVWDNGPGFPPGAAERIFSPWYSGREEGTGLGLAVTHRLVRAFGWTITAERRDNLTVFRVRAPLATRREAAA